MADITQRERELLEVLNDTRRQLARYSTYEYLSGSAFPHYSGTPSAGAIAYWTGAGTVAAAGFGTVNVAQLSIPNAFTGNQAISGTATSGTALSVVRNLTSSSTDSPVVDIVQDHASDDQTALRVRQDGTSNIIDAVSNRNHSSIVNVSNSDTTNTTSRAVFRALSGTVDMRFQSITGFGAVIGSETDDDLYFVTNATARMFIAKTNGNIGIGVTSPQGKLHVHDGTGGSMHVSKTGIVGSAQTIIPDGTGDVASGVFITGVVTNGSGAYTSVNQFLANNATVDISTDGGTNSVRFAVSAAGALTVIRQAGANTWAVTLHLVWK